MSDEWTDDDDPKVRALCGYALRAHVRYQDGRYSLAPTLVFADADYEVGDGTCGLHSDGKQANEPAIVYTRVDALIDANDRIKELEDKLEKAVEDKLDAFKTLNAWFDRRKLGHEAVDQAIVDAASGYLRTSRVGGMPQEESDLVLGVIQDMARLGLFADLFARTTLAELKGQTNA